MKMELYRWAFAITSYDLGFCGLIILIVFVLYVITCIDLTIWGINVTNNNDNNNNNKSLGFFLKEC